MRRGFSLIEVVIATAMVAGSIVVVLSLLPSLIRQSAETADLYVAQRLITPIHISLAEGARTSGFVGLANSIPEMSSPLSGAWTLVAAADGVRVATAASGTIPLDDQHFLVEIWRFSEGALRFDASSTSVSFHVRISWPYQVPGVSGPTPFASRDQFSFNLALDR